MRIVVASQGLDVAPWFARCDSFTSYRVEAGVIVDCQNVPNLSLPTSQLITLLLDLGTTTVVCRNIEKNARTALTSAGIEVIDGASGTASGAARAYLASTLAGQEEELEAV